MTFDSSEILAKSIALRRFGALARVSRMTQTAGPVFHVWTPDRRYVLKLGKSPHDASISKEGIIIGLAQRQGIPAPQVEYCGVDADSEGRPFLLMRSAGEQTVLDWLPRGGPAAQTLASQMGGVLAAIHGVTLAASGDIQADRVIPHNAAAHVQRLHQLADWATAQRYLPPEDAARFKRMPMPAIDGNALCHMDFNAVHCIVSDSRIAAVVDWESAWAANPAIDLAVAHSYLEYHCPAELVRCFLDSYARIRTLPADYDALYLPVRMAHLLGMMWVWHNQRLAENVNRAARIFSALSASAH